MFNSRLNVNGINEVDQFSRGKSLGGKAFSKTGLRFFQPKFMDSLNKQTSNKYEMTTVKVQHKKQLKIVQKSQIKVDKTLKENINPDTVKVKQNNLIKQNQKAQKQKQSIVKKPVLRFCQIRGLHNIGNTCYMNSTLQCLLHLPSFNNGIIQELQKKKFSNKADVTIEYCLMLKQFIEAETSSPFIPSKLKANIGKKKCRFLGNAQQDSQQFLTAWLQLLNQQLTRVKQKCQYVQLQNDPSKKSILQLSKQWLNYYKMRDDSVICDYFQGQLISTVSCKKCSNQTVTFDNIWGLPIGLGKSSHSVNQLLQRHWNCDNQIIDYFCSKCAKHRNCNKKVEFFRLPQILVIQLKRFEFGKWKKEKIKSPIKLSTSLNLSQFTNPNAPSQLDKYKLTGVVHHFGQVDYGHYTASVFNASNKKWYLMNDSKGSQTTLQQNSNSAYLLFYQLIPQGQ